MNDKEISELKKQRNELLKEVKKIDEILENEIYNKYIGIYVIEQTK